jgi:hypothetical protein
MQTRPLNVVNKGRTDRQSVIVLAPLLRTVGESSPLCWCPLQCDGSETYVLYSIHCLVLIYYYVVMGYGLHELVMTYDLYETI